jgi:hypothetical protein
VFLCQSPLVVTSLFCWWESLVWACTATRYCLCLSVKSVLQMLSTSGPLHVHYAVVYLQCCRAKAVCLCCVSWTISKCSNVTVTIGAATAATCMALRDARTYHAHQAGTMHSRLSTL